MANAYSVSLALALALRETLDEATMPEATDRKLEYGTEINTLLNSGSALPVTKGAVLKHTCNGSDQTVDLTAIGHTLSRTVDLTGLAPVVVLIEAATANAAGVTVKTGASNGFPLLGGVSLVVVSPGALILAVANQGTQAVDSTYKNLTINGTSGHVITITVAFGAIPS